MNKPVVIGGAAVVVLAAAGWWFLGRGPEAPVVAELPAEVPVAEEGIRNPLPEATPDAPLPALADSDQPFFDSLANAAGGGITQYLVPKDLIRHIVATVDNLPRAKLAVQLRPVTATPDQLLTDTVGDQIVLSPRNAERYAPLVKVVQATDTATVVKIYQQFYPLFQEAYQGLGYPSQYFNDRLVEVIDHLLATPDLTGPIELARPSVVFIYQDPALEALSSGQKTLIRMGPAHAGVIKAKLREFRAAVATQTP